MEPKQLHYLLPPAKHYPGRLNLYNKPKVFNLIKSNLSDANWSRLCNSCFGPVVKLGDSLKVHSQLIHFVLMHELKTQYKHEMWFRVGGNVCRFSLSDFAAVTGLNCSDHKPIDIPAVDMVKEVGGKRCSYADLVREFVRIKDEEKKFKIANLLIIAGVLLPQRSNVDINPSYVSLLSNYEEFNAYPWGRICYNDLIQSLKKLNQSDRDFSKFDDPEYRYGYNVYGYPIAFMVWILESFPAFRGACDFTCRDPKEAPYILRWKSISIKHVRHSELDEFKFKKLECVYPSYLDYQAYSDYKYPDEVVDPVFDDLIERIIGKERYNGKTARIKTEEAESSSYTKDNMADFVLTPMPLAFKKGDSSVAVNVNKNKSELAKVGGKGKSTRAHINVNQGNVKPLEIVGVDKGKKRVAVDKGKAKQPNETAKPLEIVGVDKGKKRVAVEKGNAKQPNETAKRGKKLQLSCASEVELECQYKKRKVSRNVNNSPDILENDGLPLADMENKTVEDPTDDVEVAKILFSVKDTCMFVDSNAKDDKAQDKEKEQNSKEMEAPDWAKDLKESMSSMHSVMKDVQFRLNQIETQVVHVRNEVGFIQKRMNARDSAFDGKTPCSDAENGLDIIVEQPENIVAAQVNVDDFCGDKADYVVETKDASAEETKGDSVQETKADSVQETNDDSVQEPKGNSSEETKEGKDDSVEKTLNDSVEGKNGWLVEETRDDSVQETECDLGEIKLEMLDHLRADLDFELPDILQDIQHSEDSPQ